MTTTTSKGTVSAVNSYVRGGGEPLLLLNGMVADGRSWSEPWLHRLETSFELLMVDNRGTGSSSPVIEPFTMGEMALDVIGALDRCGIDSAHVLGQSMGGMVAMTLAMEHPERVRRLVVVASSPGGTLSVPPRPEVMAELMTLPANPSRGVHMWRLASGPGFADRKPELAAEVAEQHEVMNGGPNLIGLQLRAMASFDSSRLGTIMAPTLVIHGEADPLVPVENGGRLAAAIPGARLTVLRGVGHLVPYEAEVESARLVKKFLLQA